MGVKGPLHSFELNPTAGIQLVPGYGWAVGRATHLRAAIHLGASSHLSFVYLTEASATTTLGSACLLAGFEPDVRGLSIGCKAKLQNMLLSFRHKADSAARSTSAFQQNGDGACRVLCRWKERGHDCQWLSTECFA